MNEYFDFTDIDDIRKVSENYYGSYDSDEDFAESFLNEVRQFWKLSDYVYRLADV